MRRPSDTAVARGAKQMTSRSERLQMARGRPGPHPTTRGTGKQEASTQWKW